LEKEKTQSATTNKNFFLKREKRHLTSSRKAGDSAHFMSSNKRKQKNKDSF
jgi:hypothetical protein